MTKVTNTAVGPRGVITKDGNTVYLEPGESADLELHPDHDLYEGVKKGAAGKEAASNEPKALSAMNKAELLHAAAADGVTTALDGDDKEVPVAEASNKQIAAAIEKARAAKQ